MEHSNDSEFVEYEEIFATFNPSDRAFLKSILDAEGIKYFLQGEHATTYVYHAIPVRLMVRKDQVHKAKEILIGMQIVFFTHIMANIMAIKPRKLSFIIKLNKTVCT